MIKRSDWVKASADTSSMVGIVKRVAADGSWVDVDWGHWTKRMQTKHLIVQTTIPLKGGWSITDMTREKEVGHE